MDKAAPFEQQYPKYPFAELVRLAIGLGARISRWRGHGGGALSMGEIYDPRLADRAA